MAACAFGLAHTTAFGNFADLSTTAADLQRYVGHGVGDLLALAVLDGSLIGANLTALTTSLHTGRVYPEDAPFPALEAAPGPVLLRPVRRAGRGSPPSSPWPGATTSA